VIVDLGRLHGLMRKNDDELQVYQEALEEVRGDVAHASTPQLEIQLSRILTQMGPNVHESVQKSNHQWC